MSLPPHMCADDPAAADPARRRLMKSSPFPRFPSLPSRTSTTHSLPLLSSTPSTDEIRIDDVPLPVDDHDVYRWAVLYENQRGITLFSAPFYSAHSLLPSDPPPFTIPHTRNTPFSRSTLSLDNYPLPDGTWRWISTTWMIDMRTHLGEVQYDGFEYNWSFRDNHWHAHIGKLGTGAWVRRRRWVRLMMRPANRIPPSCNGNSTSDSCPTSRLSLADADHDISHTWDGSEQDWQYVHRLLRHLGRDGRKLELWRMWLDSCVQTRAPDTKGKGRQSDTALEKRLSDVVPQGSTPSLQHLTPILRNHGEAILHSLVFPDSRAQFVNLVRQAGLTQVFAASLGHDFSVADVDFWSYADKRNRLLDRDG